jgi:hypothetical protein
LHPDDAVATDAILTIDAITGSFNAVDSFLAEFIANGGPAAAVDRVKLLSTWLEALRSSQSTESGSESGFGGPRGGRGRNRGSSASIEQLEELLRGSGRSGSTESPSRSTPAPADGRESDR